VKRAIALLVCVACHACHGGGGDPNADKPSSCIIEHDGGVTQCFEDIGQTAKKDGAKICEAMHGTHTFRVAEACPTVGLVGSCTKRSNTDLERIERCYREETACEARCVKSGGTFRK
jgi:hypothetical protein